MPVATSARIGFEKAKIYQVIKTDNSDRPSTFVATSRRENKCTAMLSLPHGDRISALFLFIIFYLFR